MMQVEKTKLREALTGNYAAAYAVKAVDVDVIAVYPITPQTTIVEKLSEFVANGELNAEIIHVESEHSALSAVVGASAAGARVFTATSSQGLELAHEVLHIASGLRLPIVMRIPVVDTKGRPVSQLSATADKFDAAASAGYVEVKVYKPEPFSLEISYKGVKAAQVAVNSLVANPQPITLGIYTVKVTVVGAFNQPIAQASVSLEGFPASGQTSSAGSVTFPDVLAGTYKVNVDVAGRVKVSDTIDVNGDVEKVVKTPIVAMGFQRLRD